MEQKFIQIQSGGTDGRLYALDSLGCVWKNLNPDNWESWIMIFPGLPQEEKAIARGISAELIRSKTDG